MKSHLVRTLVAIILAGFICLPIACGKKKTDGEQANPKFADETGDPKFKEKAAPGIIGGENLQKAKP